MTATAYRRVTAVAAAVVGTGLAWAAPADEQAAFAFLAAVGVAALWPWRAR